MLILRVITILLLLISANYCDVNSPNGTIRFDSNSDNLEEARLNTTGLGIGMTPNASLSVNGNIVISDNLTSGNLNLTGTWNVSPVLHTSSNYLVLDQSYHLVSTQSSQDILLQLPPAVEYPNQIVHIKKTFSGNNLTVFSSSNIDNSNEHILSNGGYLKLLSDSSNWIILDSHNSNSSSTFNSNLQVYLNFDDNLNDLSGTSNNGTLIGNTYNNAITTGPIENALTFDGIDDYIQIADDNSLDLTNEMSISFWIKPSSDNLTLSSITNYTNLDLTSGEGANDPGEVSLTLIGNTYYYVSAQHNGNNESTEYASSNLDTSGISWTSFTSDPQETEDRDAFSLHISSDGNLLYFTALTQDSDVEAFYTASSNLDYTGFTGWIPREAPDGSGDQEPGFIDCIIVEDQLHIVAFIHDGSTENVSYSSANLDGSGNLIWTKLFDQPGGSGGGGESSSVGIESDGQKLYYAFLATNGTGETLTHGMSDLDHSDYLETQISDIPDIAEGNYSSHISLCLVGNKLHYGLLNSNSTGIQFYTAYSDLDASNFSSWTFHGNIYTTDPSTRESMSIDMVTTGTNLNYFIHYYDESTANVQLSSIDINSTPVLSKPDAYTLHYAQGGFILDWSGPRIKFGNISTTEFSHVAITHDGTFLKCYINGNEIRRQRCPIPFSTSSQDLRIGGDGTTFFSGQIDNLRLYNKALNATEISQLSGLSR